MPELLSAEPTSSPPTTPAYHYAGTIISTSLFTVSINLLFLRSKMKIRKKRPSLLNVKRKAAFIAWDILPFIVTWIQVVISPYTKVEESFTLHAVHDVLAHGLWRGSRQNWDHVTFPGAVPRSFLPSTLLAGISYPVVQAALLLGLVRNKLDIQIIIRLILASVFSVSFAQLAKSLRYRYGSNVRIWFILLSLTQFHVPYYAGRTLPNFMALPGVYLSIAWIIRAGATSVPQAIRRKRVRMAIALLTFLATNTRLEIALFLFPVTAGLALSGLVTVGDAVLAGATGGFGALLIAGPIDYYLWSPALPHPSLPTFTSSWQIIWPELSSMHYNLLQGQSANWGIMSKHYYFTNSLPKLLMGCLPLAGLSVLLVLCTRLGVGRKWIGLGHVKGIEEVLVRSGLGAGVVGLLGGLSAVGHKEWRFVVYAVPIVNVLAAMSASALWSTTPPRIRPLFRLGLMGILGLQTVATFFLTFISINNYPGGEVWKALESSNIKATGGRPPVIHFSSYPLQTGASLFTFLHDTSFSSFSSFSSIPANGTIPSESAIRESHINDIWTYSKSEDPTLLTPSGAASEDIDYVVLESGTEGEWLQSEGGRWEVVREIEGLKGVRRGGKFGVRVEWDKRVVILGRTSGQM